MKLDFRNHHSGSHACSVGFTKVNSTVAKNHAVLCNFVLRSVTWQMKTEGLPRPQGHVCQTLSQQSPAARGPAAGRGPALRALAASHVLLKAERLTCPPFQRLFLY